MSFVGTRPEAVKYVKKYKPEYMAIWSANELIVIARYDIQKLSDDENRMNAMNDLKMAIPKLRLISMDDRVVKEVEKFIYLKNEEQFNLLVSRLRRDLYK